MRSVNVPPTSTPSRFTADPLLGLEDDFAEVLAPLHRLHRLASLDEWIDAVDEGRDLADPCQLKAALDLLAGVDERADDRLLGAEERNDVEGDDLSRVPAADHHAPVLRERVEPRLEELAADVLVDEVDATALGEAHDLLDHVLRLVVDSVVHPQLGGPCELLFRARVADHMRAGKVRELYGGRADAAAHGVDEHRLADLQPTAREEHVPGCAEGDLERSRRLIGELFGYADQLSGRAREL